MSGTKNIQLLDAMMGGVTPYRIDVNDGAQTDKAFDALYVAKEVILTTLTDSADGNLLTTCNITTDADAIQAGMIIKPAQGLTIKAVTVKTADTGVVYGITLPSPSV